MAPLSWRRPNGVVEQLPEEPPLEITNGKKNFPTVFGKLMGHETFLPMFISYAFFKDGQRHLVREEVVLIMRLVFYGEDYNKNNNVFEDFENPASKVSKAYRSLDEPTIRPWMSLIGGWLTEIRQVYKSARDIEKALSGFTGSLPQLEIPKEERPPQLNNEAVRNDQYFTIYALVNWCKDSLDCWGQKFSHHKAYCRYLNIHVAPKAPSIFKTFTDPNKPFTQTVARTISKYHLENFFGAKAYEIVQMAYPGVVLELPSRPDARGDDVAGVTRAMESSSLGATASWSNQIPPPPSLEFPENLPSGGAPRRMQEERDRGYSMNYGSSQNIPPNPYMNSSQQQSLEKWEEERPQRMREEAKNREESDANAKKRNEKKNIEEEKKREDKGKGNGSGKRSGKDRSESPRDGPRKPRPRTPPNRGRPWGI